MYCHTSLLIVYLYMKRVKQYKNLIRTSITRSWPSAAAHIRGVKPPRLFSVTFKLAPCSRISIHVEECPDDAA